MNPKLSTFQGPDFHPKATNLSQVLGKIPKGPSSWDPEMETWNPVEPWIPVPEAGFKVPWNLNQVENNELGI